MRVALLGASGRMGQAIDRLASESNVTVVARGSQGDDLGALVLAKPAVVIDFSSPEATAALAPLAARAGIPLVIGTTGLDEPAMQALDDAARRVAVFVASNMSVGVHVLGELVARATAMLGEGFDIEIVEAHHRKKADAPSGTALTLLERARSAREASAVIHGRSGRPGPRTVGEVGMHAVRGGDVVGDHHVHFLGDGERLELVHRATNRDVFARGALRAAHWLVSKPAGRYTMTDLVG